LSKLHNILQEYSQSLLSNDPPQPLNLGANQDGYVYGSGNQEIAFLCNNDDTNSATVTYAGQNYILPAWSCTLLGARQFLYNTQTINSMWKGDFNYLPIVDKRQASIEWWQDSFKPWGGNSFFAQSPPEQISVTHDKTDYLWYFTQVNASSSGTFNITVSNANDFLAAFIDDQLIASGKGGISVIVQLIEGVHNLQLLTSTLGLINIDPHMEQWTRGIQGNVFFDGEEITYSGWNVQPGTLGEYLQVFTQTGSGLVSWQSTDSTNQPMTWYKFYVDVDLTSEAPLSLDLQTMNKGFVWINGIPLARYWLLTAEDNCETCDNYTGTYSPDQCRAGCGGPSQRYYHVPKDYLQPNQNMFVVLEELGGDANGIELVERTGGVVCGMQQENWPSENSIVYLECDPGTLISQVNFASFGNPQGQCQSFQQGSCNAQDSLAIVKNLCLNRSYCSVPVSIDVFGDPCPGVTKSLFAQITCA